MNHSSNSKDIRGYIYPFLLDENVKFLTLRTALFELCILMIKWRNFETVKLSLVPHFRNI